MALPYKNNSSVWAISDLHLSFGVKNKEMEIFGDNWKEWTKKIESSWKKNISSDDLVLIPGDISWAMKAKDTVVDLEWIDNLPGTKVIIKGNHDYWWKSKSKVENILPPTINIIQNSAFNWKNVSIAGTRLWDTEDFNFNDYIDFRDNGRKEESHEYISKIEYDEKIYLRELNRLELSLQNLNPDAEYRIAMTHYPPLDAELNGSKVSKLFEKYNINFVVFGHLHSLKPNISLFGNKNGITYSLVSCDYLGFKPLKII